MVVGRACARYDGERMTTTLRGFAGSGANTQPALSVTVQPFPFHRRSEALGAPELSPTWIIERSFLTSTPFDSMVSDPHGAVNAPNG
jgi:hypothetical protein